MHNKYEVKYELAYLVYQCFSCTNAVCKGHMASAKRHVFSCYKSPMLCKYWQVKALLLLRFCQMILIFTFEKLSTTVKDLCKLTSEWWHVFCTYTFGCQFTGLLEVSGFIAGFIYFIRISTSHFWRKLFALHCEEIVRTHFQDHIHHGDVYRVYVTLVFFQIT